MDQGTTVSKLNTSAMNSATNGGHTIAYGGRSGGTNNPDIIYAAASSNVLVQTTNGGGFAPTSPSGNYIYGVSLNPDTWSTAYAVDANQVFMTTNSGGTWTNVTGNLLTESDPNLRSVLALGDAVIVGGSKGVYLMYASNPGTWYDLGSGMPNVPAWDLFFDPQDSLLVVGTLGRGAWTLPMNTSACNDLTCYVDTNAVQDALANTPAGEAITVRGTHTIAAGSYNAGDKNIICSTPTVSAILQSTAGATLSWTSGTAIDVQASGECSVKGLNLTGATTIFNQSGGTLDAYANNISSYSNAYSSSGGTATLGQNYWGTNDPTASDPGLPTGDWGKRLGAAVSSWSEGDNSTSLGSAGLNGGTGTAVIVNHGRGLSNAPFGNGTAGHGDDTCSDYYDFFVRLASGTWTVQVPVDDNSNCNTNTLAAGALFRITDVSECAPASNTACWDRISGAAANGQNLEIAGLSVSELGGTPMVAGTSQGNDPTAISLAKFAETSSSNIVLVLIPIGLFGAILIYQQQKRKR